MNATGIVVTKRRHLDHRLWNKKFPILSSLDAILECVELSEGLQRCQETEDSKSTGLQRGTEKVPVCVRVDWEDSSTDKLGKFSNLQKTNFRLFCIGCIRRNERRVKA